MHISTINISNFRNFKKDFKLNLKPFTLILGENNVGKTNLLHAIGLVLSTDISFYKKRNLNLDDINKECINTFKNNLIDTRIKAQDIAFPKVTIEITFQDFNDDLDLLSVMADWFIDTNFEKAKLTYAYLCRSLNQIEWIETTRQKINQLEQGEKESDIEFLFRKKQMINFPIENYSYVIYGGEDTSKSADFYFLRMLKMEYLDALRDSDRELTA